MLQILSSILQVGQDPQTESLIFNKSSAVAEMGDRLATIGIGRKWRGGVVEGWVPI